MFWGLKLERGRHYSQLVDKSFHISHATLAIGSKVPPYLIAVHAIVDKTDYVLCYLGTVSGNVIVQQPLNLEVTEGEEIVLHTAINDAKSDAECTVYLTGYFREEMYPLSEQLLDSYEEEEEDEDLSEDEELYPHYFPIEELSGGGGRRGDKAAQAAAGDGEKTRKKRKLSEAEAVVNGLSGDVPAVKRKKLKKKNKKKNDKKKTDVSEENVIEQKDNENNEVRENGATSTTEGGTLIEEVRVGTGRIAKPGRKVFIKYTGRLLHNKKIFDSNLDKKKPFMFRLGQGEVVKGMDEGIEGMRMNGERRLTLPVSQGYGAKGMPPKVPPNSKLLFDVQLINVL